MLCRALAVVMRCSTLVSGPGAREGRGEVVLCVSSMRFTFEVLDLVFLAGAGDGEMGGDGESSPAITGIDKVGFPMVLLGLRAEGGGHFVLVAWEGLHRIPQQGIRCFRHAEVLAGC